MELHLDTKLDVQWGREFSSKDGSPPQTRSGEFLWLKRPRGLRAFHSRCSAPYTKGGKKLIVKHTRVRRRGLTSGSPLPRVFVSHTGREKDTHGAENWQVKDTER